MKIVYKVKFENDGVTISQDINPNGAGDSGGGGQDPIGGGGQDPIGGGGQDPIGGGGQDPIGGGGKVMKLGGQDPIGGGGQDPIGGGGQDPIGGGGQDPIGGGGENGRQIAVVFGPVVIGSTNGAAPVQARSPRTIPRHIPETTATELFGKSPRVLGSTASTAHPAQRFKMLCQAFSNWCWAAVAGAVRNEKQCEVASNVLDYECCDDGQSCNQESSLQEALGDRLLTICEGTVDFEVVQREIGDGRVVCARIAWDADRDLIEDRGHFVVISGCQRRADPAGNPVPYLTILDPDGGRARRLGNGAEAVSTEIPFEDFKTRYKSVGVWTHTYILQDAPASTPI